MIPSPGPQVVVVGSFIQDLTWRCGRFPGAGETVLGDFMTGPGGKGSNQAVASARAGAVTRFIGAVGEDAFAAGARAFHAAEGIDGRLASKPGHPTGTAGILVDAAGQNEIIVAIGASARLRPADVPLLLLRGARVVVCQHETALDVNAHVFRQARRLGAATVLNPAPMRDDFDRRILALTDLLIPNENEFAALIGKPARTVETMEPGRLHALARGLGVRTVIVTLGARGCLVSDESGFLALRACRGIRVVDTTGAGDAFVGAFAAGLVRFGGDLARSARFANAAAALSITRRGTAPAMPALGEIERLLRRQPAACGLK